MNVQKVDRKNIKDILALTPLQEGLLYLYLKNPADGYVEQLELRVEGAIDGDLFWEAWDAVVRANDTLRTMFRWQGMDHPIQMALKRHRLTRVFDDFSSLSEDDALRRVEEVKKSFRDPHLLMAEVPFAVALVKTGEDAFIIVITHHHILYDGWSASILVREFLDAYRSLAAGGTIVLPEKPQFKDFVKWILSQDRDGQKKYWGRYLEGLNHEPPCFGRAESAGAALKLTTTLDSNLVEDLDEYVRSHPATVAAVFYTAWGLVLQQVHRSRVVVFGTTVSGRPRELAGIEELVGLCINTIPLRFAAGRDTIVEEALVGIVENLRERMPFESAPLADIATFGERHDSGELFDTIVVVENYPLDLAALSAGDDEPFVVRSFEAFEDTHYAVTVCVRLLANGIDVDVLYPRGRFLNEEIAGMACGLIEVLRQMIEDPSRACGCVNMAACSEREALLRELNREGEVALREEDFFLRFDTTARRFPYRIALIEAGFAAADECVSYGQLRRRSLRAAAALKKRGIGPGRVVAVVMEPGVELVVAVFAVLGAGGAYIPLDPSLPEARIAYIIDDCAVHLTLDRETVKTLAGEAAMLEDMVETALPSDPAYVIYTSGSTGTPKGVMVERRAAANTLRALADRYPVDADDVVCFKTSFMFDVSVSELFGWYSCGGKMLIAGPAVARDPAALLAVIQRGRVTHMNFVPSMFNLFLDTLDEGNRDCLRALKYIFLAGEAVLPETVAKFQRLETGIQLENIYGPTEAAIYASWQRLDQLRLEAGPVPIGGPLPGVSLWVLDHWGRMQPMGTAGELYIGGAGLARGYVNRPLLTADAFVRHGETGDRLLYKTGDLARVRPDGVIEFLGRIDNQVKIRGFRIELGEIQNCLSRHPAVAQAAIKTVAVRDGELKLCAYVAATEAASLDIADLRAFLSETLPEYMVPAFFVMMDRLPQTAGGKIDLKGLPEPLRQSAMQAIAGELPGDELEHVVAEIAGELLGLDDVGALDNFFDLGGNSYTLIRLASRLKKKLDVDVPVVTLLRYPTVRQLARHVKTLLSHDGEAHSPAQDSIAPSTETAAGMAPIAVIGMACRFPGAEDINAFWDNLCGGVESIRRFSREELLAEGIDDELLNHPGYVMAGGTLDEADCFDAAYFDYTPAQARLMDPQARVFLQCCVHALEDAGVNPFAYEGRIGIFAGATTNAAWLLLKVPEIRDAADQYELLNLNSNSFVTLASYKLDLKGPAMAIQTACSTSLTAVDAACRSLWTGACDVALAGGVSVTLPLKSGYMYQEGMIQSPDGHCRAFDAQAGGTLAGNGVGIVVLKPLAAAIADEDVVDAVVKGTAVNNDGLAKVGYTAPSVEGQARVIREAQHLAGTKPESIGYVEAHGTGTPLGDPVEVEGLRLAFGEGKRGYCRIGSVKTNIGHLDAAAGIAGFIKTVLIVKHKIFPPSLHFKTPNPKIDFERSPFRVNDRLTHWDEAVGPRRAGVSSFGIGGTNAHVVLEEAPPVAKKRSMGRRFHLMVQSAGNPRSLAGMQRRLGMWLRDESDGGEQVLPADVAFTLACGRRELEHRSFCLCGDAEEAIVSLLGEGDVALPAFHALKGQTPGVVFMFSGQGSQYAGMARDLYLHEPLFQQELNRCLELLEPLLGTDPKQVLYPAAEEDWNRIDQTAMAQPLIFAVEYALARLLMSWGIKPVAMTGHSVGEYVAATLAGVFELDEALRIVATRGRLMQRMPGGAMAAVGAGEREIEPFICEGLEFAALNGERHSVISGPDENISAAIRRLEAEGFTCSRLHTSHAFHSGMMEPMLREFRQAFEQVTLKEPSLPFISNVSGAWITARQAMTPGYWVEHVRRTVRFGDGLAEIFKKDGRVLVEIGAGRSLCTFARNHPAKKSGHGIVQSLRHPKEEGPDDRHLLNLAGQLWLRGVGIDWKNFYAPGSVRKIHMPGYSFEKTRFPVDARGLFGKRSRERVSVPRIEPEIGSGDSPANRPGLSSNYVAPVTDVERRLAEMWRQFFGISPIGTADDFFELGGDSLKVSSMAARVQENFGVRIPLQEFFRHTTIRRLAEFVERNSPDGAEGLPLFEKKEYYPLSPAQRRVYVAQQVEPESVLYNMPVVLELTGDVEPERFRRAFHRLMERHESLRVSCFVMGDDLAMKVCEIGEAPLEILEIAGRSDEEIIETCVRPFDLSVAPLFRAALVKTRALRYLLVFDIHHIVSDGVSMGILVKDFIVAYGDENMPPLAAGYCDYAGWMDRRRLFMREHEAFWREQLRPPLPMNRIPTDFSQARRNPASGDLLESFLEPDLVLKLKEVGWQHEATLFMVLFSVYSILLANLCGQEDLVAGVAAHGRAAGWTQPLVGMFVNTLAVRVKPLFSNTYGHFLRELKLNLLECFQRQEFPLEEMAENPALLLDTLFVLQNMEVPDLRLPGLVVAQIPFHHKVSRFPMTVMAEETGGGVRLSWEYDNALFRRDTVLRFASYFREIARRATEDPDVRIVKITIYNSDEEERLLREFNRPGEPVEGEKTFQQMFACQARSDGDAIAITGFEPVFGGDWSHVTYGELDRRSNHLARRLLSYGVRRQDIAALMAPRSPSVIAAILGILKAGAIYLPIEDYLPLERKRFLLADSAAGIAIVLGGVAAGLDIPASFCLAEEMEGGCDDSPLQDSGLAGDAAYIIYTSGTTGTPKGVVVEHRGLAGLRQLFSDCFHVGAGSRVLQFAAFSFDASVWELAMGMLTGAALAMVADDIKMDAALLGHFMKRQCVTIATFPPAVAGYLEPGGLGSLKWLITAGSEASAPLLDIWRKRTMTVNAYGPTETTVCASYWPVPQDGELPDAIPIGRPLQNAVVTIIDRYGRMCPIGTPGEIVVSGSPVARGYLNRPQLTAGYFGNSTGDHSLRSYRTGDQGRFTAEGTIEYLGRLDDQVKIRGFRVEPGEVQAVLSRSPDVHDCWVLPVADDDGDLGLAAYVVAQAGRRDEDVLRRLREYLEVRLPAYMTPDHVIMVPGMPLTAHGKPDRSRLPNPFEYRGAAPKPPQGDRETWLAHEWSSLLGIPIAAVGHESHFFQSGGQSLKAVRLAARIRQETGKALTVTDIFRFPILRQMARHIETLPASHSYPPLLPSEKQDYYPVTSVQRRLFILQQQDKTSTAYNMPVLLTLEGVLNKDRLAKAFAELVARHESFRTSFAAIEGQLVQRVVPRVELEIEHYDRGSFVRPFDLTAAPLMRVALTRVSDDAHMLAVDIHHIVADGASIDILVREFLDLYSKRALAPLELQYRDYSLWLNTSGVRKILEAQKRFWMRQYSGECPRLRLPDDFSSLDGNGAVGGRIEFNVGAEAALGLKALATAERCTLFMVVLAAYYAWLSRVSGQEDIVVGVGGDGRLPAQTRRMIGMFVNTLALRFQVDGNLGYRHFLRQVRDYILQAFENQYYPFEDLVEAAPVRAPEGRNPLFDVMLRFDDLEIPPFDLPGLRATVGDMGLRDTKSHLTLVAGEHGDALDMVLEYNAGLFGRDTAELMARQLSRAMENAARDPELSLRSVTAPSQNEMETILQRFNSDIERQIAGFSPSMAIQDKILDCASRHRDAVALSQGESALSYGALERRVSSVARYLRGHGIGTGTIVGIMLKERIPIIETVLAIIKIGAVFVPLDPELPDSRLRHMIRSANCSLIVCSNETELLDASRRIPMDRIPDWKEELLAEDENPPGYLPTDPIYIYFTSGTTGLPKAFLGVNNSLLHFIQWERRHLGIGKGDRFSQLIVPTFDAFLRDVFLPLLSGGTSCLLPRKEWLLEAGILCRWLEMMDIQVVHCVPSVFRLILSGPLTSASFKGLRAVLMSGERIHPGDIGNWFRILGRRIQLFNLYGSSETTMVKSYHPITIEDTGRARVPVGLPIDGAAIVVLDSAGQACGPLATGEIYIASQFTAAGYLDDPELTCEKFIVNRFRQHGLPRLYRTGDTGRMLACGSLDFIGREDRQVKIRGIRVELAEIEWALLQCPLVAEGAVVCQTDDDVALLFAFVGLKDLDEGHDDPAGYVSRFLETLLPSYMIPSRVIILDAMPRKTNGKLDYPALGQMTVRSTKQAVPPANPTERRLLELWQESFKNRVTCVETTFFEVGGNSLNVMKLLLKIQREFETRISLQDLFRLPTVRLQALELAGSVVTGGEDLKQTEKMDYYPLSPQQSRLYFLQHLTPNGIHYNMSSCFSLEGEIDGSLFKRTLLELAARQHSLRTSFAVVDGNPVQRICAMEAFDIDILYLDGSPGQSADTDEIIRRFIQPFDLSSPPLFRLGLIDLGDDRSIMVLDYHHIIGDGISGELFIGECMAIYRGQRLEPPAFQYVDFAVWKHGSGADARFGPDRDYWLDRFSDDVPVLELPLDFERPPLRDTCGERIDFALSQLTRRRLRHFSESRDATLFMVLLSAFYICLARISGQLDIVVGTPVAGRTHKESQSIIGMFVNSLALRQRIELEDQFEGLLGRVKLDVMNALSNQEYQLEALVEELAVDRDMARNPLFDVMFVLQNFEKREIELPGLSISPYRHASPVSRFDLTLWTLEGGDDLEFSLEYSTRLFRRRSAQNFATYFQRILAAVLEDPLRRVMTIDLLSAEEKSRLLNEFNDSDSPYPRERMVHEIVSILASHAPWSIAVEMESIMLSYGELERRSNALALHLRERGVSLEDVIGVLAFDCIELIVTVIAILRAGGVVLPIDPALPESRITFLMNDAACRLVLDSRHLILDSGFLGNSRHRKGMPVPTAQSLAYIIYSSGTTGKPKGSLISHQNIARLLCGPGIVDFQSRDKYMQLVNYMFDVSIFDIFTPLLNGGTLLLIDKTRMMEPGRLQETILRHGVTMTFFPTSLFNMIVENDIQCLAPLRKIVVGGEALSFGHTKNALEYLGPGRIVNGYGPSENSMFTTFYEFHHLEGSRVPIGKPCPNGKVYILDCHGNLQPEGIIGELCAGGYGVARGYLNRPLLTAEKFVPHPFLPGVTIYRTGDLARWLPDGDIEFFGRIDHQVKIRGFRIELGEIEARLLEHPDVREAVVTALRDHQNDSYLCAYLVLEPGMEGIDPIREYVTAELPSYMVPASFVSLDALPLTANGKVDRKALPEPGLLQREFCDDEPEDELQRGIAAIWANVLGCPVKQVGIRRKFFDCGGQSLKATVLMSRLHKEFRARMPLAVFYRNPTVAGIAQWIRQSREKVFDEIPAAEAMEYYPLSFAQRRLFFLARMDPDSAGYNLTSVVSIRGRLDRQLVRQTFEKLIERHEIFRTSFHVIADEPVQIVLDEVPFEVEFEALPQCDIDDRQRIEPLVSRFIRPFDLSRPPLLRVELIQLAGDAHIMVLDMHHIITDGTSMNLLIREFSRFYSLGELPPLTIQYKDFSVWQQHKIRQEPFENQKSFWLRQFAGEIPVLDLPLDFPRPAMRRFTGGFHDFSIRGDLLSNLKSAAREHDATIFMMLLALVNIFFARICRQEDVVVGAPIAGRTHSALEPLVGMFVNTLALRNVPKMGMTVRDFMKDVKHRTIQAFEHQEFPFELLVDLVVERRDMSRNPLFDVMFALQNMDMEGVAVPGLTVRPFRHNGGYAKFDLSLVGIESPDSIDFTFEYSAELYRDDSIARFVGHFLYLARCVAENSQSLLREIDLLPPHEKRQILYDVHGKSMEIPDVPLHGLFERQAHQDGDRVALELEDGALSYRELNELADRLAGRIVEFQVAEGRFVPVCLKRSIEMMIGILGVLKAGSAYIPLDPSNPVERLEYIVRDSGAAIVVVAGNDHPFKGYPIHKVDVMETRWCDNCRSGDVIFAGNQMDPAYVIYTSGTTGRPKGVVIEHRSVINLITYQSRSFGIDSSDRILQFSSYCFDASVEQIFLALLCGARLVLVSQEIILDLDRFHRYIASRNITHVNAVPSFLGMVELRGLTHVKRVVSGGDTCPTGLVEKFSQKFLFYNQYGPSETTVTVLKALVKHVDGAGSVAIGRPLGNTTAYILDLYGGLLPDGIPGELFIGGLGVGRGYLNQPELTAEKFVVNPHVKGERIYKTGDLVKRNPVTGDIEYLGRIDHQVKIRGFRIETGEIESLLLEYPGIAAAAVVARQSRNGELFLCAYLSGETGGISVAQLEGRLRERLPEYMIPANFVFLDGIPLNTNGKVDKNALPEPDMAGEGTFAAPTNRIERNLVELWSEVLKIAGTEIGIDHNFFQLGGHSLRATILASRIEKALKVKIPLAEIFRASTIREMAAYINRAAADETPAIPAIEEMRYYPLSPSQKMLYIEQQMEAGNLNYNISIAVLLQGALDIPRLREVFVSLARRHESFRTAFAIVDGEPRQVIAAPDDAGFEITIRDLTGNGGGHLALDEEEQQATIRRFIRPFDLSHAPLLRVELVKYSESQCLMLADMHHIVADGTSTGILMREFMDLYDGKTLQPLNIQYKDYAVWMQSDGMIETLERQEAYWLDLLTPLPPRLDLPFDFPRGDQKNYEGERMEFLLPAGLYRGIVKLAAANDMTPFMVLLAAFTILLARLCGQEDVVVGTPVANRRHADLEPIIGMFVNTLALRNRVIGEQNLDEFLLEVRARTLQAFENQEYPFETLAGRLMDQRRSERNAIFDVFFSMENEEIPEVSIHGLEMKPAGYQYKRAPFDLVLICKETEASMQASFLYPAALFKGGTIERFFGYFQEIASAMTGGDCRSLLDISISHRFMESRHSILEEASGGFDF